MNECKVIIEKGTRYFYDENNFCYKNEPFSRFYKVSEKKSEYKGFPEITLPKGSSKLVDKAIQEAERKLSENTGYLVSR